MIINKLTLNKNLGRIPTGTVVQARNVRLDDNFEFLTNEEGFDKVCDFQNDICGIIATDVELVVFTTNNEGDDRLYLVEGGSASLLLKGTFNWSTDFPINGEWIRNNKGELIIVFNDTVNEVRVFNVHNPYMGIDPVTKELVSISDGLNKLKLTPDFVMPTITTSVPKIIGLGANYINSGGLPKGAYQVVLSYYIGDFDRLNWSIPSNVTNITKSRFTRFYYKATYKDGGNTKPASNIEFNDIIQLANEPNTDKALSVNISVIDTRFEKYKLAVIHRTDTGVAVYDMGDHLTSVTKHVIANLTDVQLSIEEVTVPYVNYNRVQDMTVIDHRLAFLGTNSDGFVDYQKYANNIKVRYTTEKVFGGYSISIPIFDEVYALNIGLIGKDGIVKGVYHIPGRRAEMFRNRQEDALLTEADKLLYNTENGNNNTELSEISVKYLYQLYNTAAALNSNGKLGFWQNKDEYYPDRMDFDVFDVDENGEGFKIDTIRGENVRHHKIPDLANLLSDDIGDNPSVKLFLTFSDIKFPKEILNSIQGYFIAYTNRDSANSTVHGHHPIIYNNFWTNKQDSTDDTTRSGLSINPKTFSNSAIRFNDFALLYNKPQLANPYLRGIYKTERVGGSQMINNNEVVSTNIPYEINTEIRKIMDYQYVPRDNAATDPTNKGREAALLLKLNTLYPSLTRTLFCALKSDIDNVFMPFYGRKVSIASEVMHVTDDRFEYEVRGVSNFDGYLSLYHNFMFRGDQTLDLDEDGTPPIIQRVDGDEDKNAATILTAYKTLNISTVDTDARSYDNHAEDIDYQDKRSWFKNLFKNKDSSYTYESNLWADPSTENIISYNRQYSFTNSITTYFTHNYNNVFVDNHPYRVARSLVFNKEALTLNWRYFSALEYYEMPKHRGFGKAINSVDSMLLIHMEHSLYVARIKDKLETLEGDTFLGVADIFDRAPEEVLSTRRGALGIQSRFAGVISEMGYVFADTYDKSVYVFSNGQLDTLTDDSVRGLHNKYIRPSLGNPLKKSDVIVGIDNLNDRIIVTSHSDMSFTMSYCYNGSAKHWVGLHDYLPAIIVNNRIGTYAVNRYNLKSIYKFNSEDTSKFGVYFDNRRKSYVDILINENPTFDKILNSVSFQSGIDNDANNIQELFVYTRNQCSKVYQLGEFGTIYDFDKLRFLAGFWNYDMIRDYTSDDIVQNIVDDFGNINHMVINNTKEWYELGDIADKFFIVRLITNNARDMIFRDLEYNVTVNRR